MAQTGHYLCAVRAIRALPKVDADSRSAESPTQYLLYGGTAATRAGEPDVGCIAAYGRWNIDRPAVRNVALVTMSVIRMVNVVPS